MTTLTIKFPNGNVETMRLINVLCVEDIVSGLRLRGTLITPVPQLEVENHFGEGFIIVKDILTGDEICWVEW